METQEITSYASVAADNNISEEAFTLFCENQHVSAENCEDMVTAFNEAYVSDYFGEDDFAREYYFNIVDLTVIPEVLVDAIDWDYVWESTLRHDFYCLEGYVFRNI